MNFLNLKKNKVKTDEEKLAEVIALLGDGVEVSTGFMQDENDNITHQVIQLKCGNLISVSQPERLDVVLRLATAEEQGELVN